MTTPARTLWERDRRAARENPWMWKVFGLLGLVNLLNGVARINENDWLAALFLIAAAAMLTFSVWCFRQTRRPSGDTARHED